MIKALYCHRLTVKFVHVRYPRTTTVKNTLLIVCWPNSANVTLNRKGVRESWKLSAAALLVRYHFAYESEAENKSERRKNCWFYVSGLDSDMISFVQLIPCKESVVLSLSERGLTTCAITLVYSYLIARYPNISTVIITVGRETSIYRRYLHRRNYK